LIDALPARCDKDLDDAAWRFGALAKQKSARRVSDQDRARFPESIDPAARRRALESERRRRFLIGSELFRRATSHWIIAAQSRAEGKSDGHARHQQRLIHD
jgi:hypothetical protein